MTTKIMDGSVKNSYNKCFGLLEREKRKAKRMELVNEIIITDKGKLVVIDLSSEKRRLYSDKNEGKYLDCTGCKTIKPVEEFNNQTKGWKGKASECKECMGARSKKWYKSNLDKQREEFLIDLFNEHVKYDGTNLYVTGVNQRRTRKAYKNDLGECFLTCGKCKDIKPIDSFNNANKGFLIKRLFVTIVDVCNIINMKKCG